MATTHEPRWLDPDERQAWLALAAVLARLPAALEAQLQRDAGISRFEYQVMAGLSEAPARTLRMSELAVFVNAELSRMSHLIKRLEKRGLVRREPDPTDGRYTNAILTDAGWEHLVRAAPGHVTAVRTLVFDALDKPALDAIRTASDKIIARTEDH